MIVGAGEEPLSRKTLAILARYQSCFSRCPIFAALSRNQFRSEWMPHLCQRYDEGFVHRPRLKKRRRQQRNG